MKAINLGITELNNYELDRLKNIDENMEVWYQYEARPHDYDGIGVMLIKSQGLYYIHDMGHCSCYGPTCEVSLSKGFKKLEDVKASCSKEYWFKDVQPLFEAAFG